LVVYGGIGLRVGSYLGFGLSLSLPLLYLHKKRRGPAAFAQLGAADIEALGSW
jgi:hypothetical protein